MAHAFTSINGGPRMERNSVIPLEHQESDVYSIREEDFEALTTAFKSFSEASKQLQAKYDELKEESLELKSQLRKKEVEIQKNEQLATLGKTAAALAHEIRNPLGAIALYTSMLQEDLQKQPEQLELVVAIDSSVNALNQVVSNILQFAQHHSNSFSPTSLASVLQELISELSRIHEDVEISFRGLGPLFVWGDASSLRRLFCNLIVNAIQAQNGEGTIRVVGHGTPDKTTIRIRDEGPGINDGQNEEIFEPFMTSKAEGTGLGLAICREIARAHNGTISASNWNRGAEFTVEFLQNRELEKKDE